MNGYLARNEDGTLYWFEYEPQWRPQKGDWWSTGGKACRVPELDDRFSHVRAGECKENRPFTGAHLA